MSDKVIAALPELIRPHIEAHLPDWLEPRWLATAAEALVAGADAEIGWFDMSSTRDMAAAIRNAANMRWLNSFITGIDFMPLQILQQRKVILTNGTGLNAVTIAEYVLLGMLSIAKGYREVVRAQDRHEWLRDAPGKTELCGSKALLIGYGSIGQRIEERLSAFQLEVTVVRRRPDPSGRMLGPGEWRARLGEFDWVILALPSTPHTERMIGAAELGAMKNSAVILNIARGNLIDQDALVAALKAHVIAAAFLDVTDPEPLPPGHPLWSLDSAHITMHLSGRSQTQMFARSGQRFLENLVRYHAGEPLQYQVDLALGY